MTSTTDFTFLLIAIFIGFVTGLSIAWLYFKQRIKAELAQTSSGEKAEIIGLRERLNNREENIAQLKLELSEKELQERELRTHNTLLEKNLSQLNERLVSEEERITSLTDLSTRFSDAFKALSLDALKSNNQSFLELANATLEKFQEGAKSDLDKRGVAIHELVTPIKESLGKVDNKLEELERFRQASQATLSEQVKVLSQTNLLLKDQTENLVQALRKPIVRGRWGEVQLKRVVELANMLPYCDFVEQESVMTESGRLRPDMIIKLPGNRNIVIDSKVPLEAYLDAIEARDEDIRISLFKDHARQVKQQIVGLSQKNYWQQFEKSPEFVILFLPGEPFFTAALEHDPSIIEFAADRNIILATPMTLIALLRAVSQGWREHEFAKNTEVVAKLGRELYERVSIVVSHVADIKKGIDKTIDAYNKTVSSLETRVLVSVRKFKELGVASTEEISELPPIEETTKQIDVQ